MLHAELVPAYDAEDEVQEFLAAHPAVSFYQTPEWLDVLARALSIDTYWMLWRDDDVLTGVFPVARSLKRWRKRLYSLPFTMAIRPRFAGNRPKDAWTRAWEAAQHAGFDAWLVKSGTRSGMRLVGRFVDSHIPLHGELADVRSRYARSVRRALRKADREGVRVEQWSPKFRGQFGRILDQSRHKLGAPAMPPRLLSALETLTEDGRLRVTFALRRQHVLATMLCCPGDPYLGVYGASLSNQDVLQYRPNDVLRDEAIAEAHARGAESLDLGRTLLTQAGLSRFKRGFGAIETPAAFTYFGVGEGTRDIGNLPPISRFGQRTMALSPTPVWRATSGLFRPWQED